MMCTEHEIRDGLPDPDCLDCQEAAKKAMNMADVWYCEGCGEEQTGEPEATDEYPGHEGPVTLWFCGECC